ncbi:MspA protein [Mycobacteroides franklinii]|uniref:MspA protein n=1 Tax=Mycobacteroides franklinii TaxID=948102 RepID=A0A1S1LCX4_9MYCO|nr:MspA family porin [Mycobacteroides franklinii]OHU28924.1 MspA protein [Mycobacteroides franklinii]
MLKRVVVLTVIGAMGVTAPPALSDPLGGEPLPAHPAVGSDSAPPIDGPEAAPPVDNGIVASAEPGVLRTREGWILAVAAKDETQLPVSPLTTALSSREYLVGGTFIGTVQGSGTTKLTEGVLEAGYQIGCGINAAEVDLRFGGGITPQISPAGAPSIGGNAFAQVRPSLKPGNSLIIPISKMAITKETTARVSITGFRIKIDSCVGQSFIRSYAIFTSSTEDTQDVVTYMGVTKAV